MPVTLVENGKNNSIDVSERFLSQGTGRIVVEGCDNRLKIPGISVHFGGFIHLQNGADVELGGDLNAHNLFIHAAKGAVLRIGRQTGFNGTVRLLMHEPATLTIGDGALFGSDVDVTISDMHSIIDVSTGRRLNPPRDVRIGNRVWIGQRCMILKGVDIGDGAAIGAGSVVTRSIPGNCVAAGNPAHVVRQNATWDFRLL